MKTIVNYAQKVKEQHALNKTLAPVETDLTSASKAYAVGQKFIHDGVLYQAKTAIAQGAALVLNTNYEAADDVSTEIEALTNQLTNEVTTRAALGAHNLFGVGNSLDEWFAATNDGKLPTSYLASETITGTVDKDTNSIVITAYNNTGYRWGCKKINLKKNTSYTFSRTSCDGTIQLFGKNNADDRAVVISGLSNGGTVNSGDYDWWYVGFYPTRSGGYFSITDLLVKLETDADTTFQSYAKTNQELTAENQTLTNNVSVLIDGGAVNKLPNTGTTDTKNGVTANYADNGIITLNASSPSTNAADFPISSTVKPFYLKEGTYILSGGASADARLYIRTVASTSAIAIDNGNGAEFTVTSEMASGGFAVYLHIDSGKTFNNVVVKPMVADADYSGGYVPYAMTNRELTDLTVLKQGSFSNGTMVSSQGMSYWQSGKVVTINGYVTMNGNQTADGTTNNKLGQFSNIDAPPVAIRVPCGIAANSWDKPTEIAYLSLDTDLALYCKTTSSGTQSVYFSMSYIAP